MCGDSGRQLGRLLLFLAPPFSFPSCCRAPPSFSPSAILRHVDHGWKLHRWRYCSLRSCHGHPRLRDRQDSVPRPTYPLSSAFSSRRALAQLTQLCSLQLQGELASKAHSKRVYTGIFQGVSVIVRNEGFRGLLAGLTTAVCLTSAASLTLIWSTCAGVLTTVPVLLPNMPQRLSPRVL